MHCLFTDLVSTLSNPTKKMIETLEEISKTSKNIKLSIENLIFKHIQGKKINLFIIFLIIIFYFLYLQLWNTQFRIWLGK